MLKIMSAKWRGMKISSMIFVSFIIVMLATGCAAPTKNYSRQQNNYYAQPGSTPPRGGYQQQMNQEQQQRNREAAGKLIPELLKIQDQMIKQNYN